MARLFLIVLCFIWGVQDVAAKELDQKKLSLRKMIPDFIEFL